MADATGHAASPNLPERIGRFQVLAALGEGASGRVYRARDPRLARDVALKVAHAGAIQTPAQVSRFLREARAAGGLRHPHIVPVYDAGQAGDAHYLAAAFIDGPTLALSLEENRLGLEEKVAAVRQVAEALAYAHRKKIVHRDVKPANILLDKRNQAYLADFGLARKEQSQSKLTQDGELPGTPAYLAPERLENSGGEPLAASDQYSLGVVLYECLCGQRPFSGPLASLIYQILNDAPAPPRKVSRGVPLDLERICLKSMARKPEDRYGDCQELADDLRRWLDGEPVRVRPPGPARRFLRWLRREPLLASGVGVSLLALLALLLVPVISAVWLAAAVHARKRAGSEREAAVKKAEDAAADAVIKQKIAEDALKNLQLLVDALEKETAQARKDEADALDARKRSQRVLADVEARKDQALASEYAAAVLLAAEDIRAGRNAAKRLDEGKADLRGFEWFLLADRTRSQGALQTIDSLTPKAYLTPTANGLVVVSDRQFCRLPWADFGKKLPPAWLPMLDVLGGPDLWLRAASPQDTLLQVHDDTLNKTMKLEGFAARGSHLAISANGKRLASFHPELLGQDQESLWLWDLTTGKKTQRYAAGNRRPTLLAISVGGDAIATVQPPAIGEIRFWRGVDPKAAGTVKAHENATDLLLFSPDVTRALLASASKTEVKLWDAAAAKELADLGKGFRSPRLRFNKDSKKLLLVQEGAEPVKLWDVEAKKWLFSLDNVKADIRSVALSEDSSLLAALSPRGDMLQLYKADTGQPIGYYFLGREGAAAVAFTPEGKQLAVLFGDGELQMLNRQHLRPSPLSNPGPAIESLAFDANSVRITASTAGGGILAWDVSTGVSLPGEAKDRKGGPLLRTDAQADGVKVIEVSSGKTLCTLATSAVTCLSRPPKGQPLVCGHEDGKVTFWETGTGKLLFEAKGAHRGAVRSLVYSPDGKTAISGGADGRICLWQPDTYLELLVLEPGLGEVLDLAFNREGTILAAGGADGRVRFWHAPRH